MKCHIVDSYFKILNHTIPTMNIHNIQIDIFLCSLIRFLPKNAKTTAIHKIADLDSVIHIATIRSTVSKKFKFFLGFFIKSFNSCRVHHHHNNIKGKKATKKYP